MYVVVVVISVVMCDHNIVVTKWTMHNIYETRYSWSDLSEFNVVINIERINKHITY